MDYNCKIRTITENTSSRISVRCYATSAQEGIERPTIFNSQILEDSQHVINGVKGKEGELILTHEDSNKEIAFINTNGELILQPIDDNAERYSLDSSEGTIKYD